MEIWKQFESLYKIELQNCYKTVRKLILAFFLMRFTVNMKITSLPEQGEFSSNTSPHCFLSIDEKCFVF